MRLSPALIPLALCLVGGVLPGTALAALEVDFRTTLNLETGYVSIISNDPALPHVKDVTTREGIAARLSVGGKYAQLVLGYRVTAVQLVDHSNLNHMVHRLGLDLDLDGLVSRFTHSGRLDVTAQISVDPSLPTLGSGATFTPSDEFDPDIATRERVLEERLLASGDMLLVQEDRSGYTTRLGLNFSDEAGRTGRYNIGAHLTDNRFDSKLLPETSVLHVSGGYTRAFLRNEAGLQFGHRRYVRGGNDEQTVNSMSLSFARRSYRIGWQVGSGVAHVERDDAVRSTASASCYYRGRRIAFDGRFRSDINDTDLSVIGFFRTRSGGIRFHPVRPGRFPWSVSAGWSGFFSGDRYTARADQGVIWNDAVSGGISYTRTETLIDDPAGVDRRSSDTVLLRFVWRFI